MARSSFCTSSFQLQHFLGINLPTSCQARHVSSSPECHLFPPIFPTTFSARSLVQDVRKTRTRQLSRFICALLCIPASLSTSLSPATHVLHSLFPTVCTEHPTSRPGPLKLNFVSSTRTALLSQLLKHLAYLIDCDLHDSPEGNRTRVASWVQCLMVCYQPLHN